MSAIFRPIVAIQAADFYQLDLVTNDEVQNIFPNDLGVGSTERRILRNCALVLIPTQILSPIMLVLIVILLQEELLLLLPSWLESQFLTKKQ